MWMNWALLVQEKRPRWKVGGKRIRLVLQPWPDGARLESRGQGGATRGGWEWNLLRRG